jgi:hypothetical protein
VVSIPVKDTLINGHIEYKRYKSYDTLSSADMTLVEHHLQFELPHLPPAGKMMYRVILKKGDQQVRLNQGKFVVLRYKGKVPVGVLVPHIFFMFLSLLFASRAFLAVLTREAEHAPYLVNVVMASLFLGGLILGPIVQKYAFGAYWTGWPIGHDLTDNKTFLMFVFWLIAWFKIRKDPLHRLWVIVAMFVMMAVYLIPHSAWGSEIDYTKKDTSQQTEQIKNQNEYFYHLNNCTCFNSGLWQWRAHRPLKV